MATQNTEYEKCVKDPEYFLLNYCGCIKKGTDIIMPINLTKDNHNYNKQ